ncbi:MAG: homogentisate 1,2-dioxygenase [Candidatus Kapaibacterium sp.]
MPFYHKLGIMPSPKHTAFRKTDGSLYTEELVSTKGFSDVYSNKYHIHPPTKVLRINELPDIDLKLWEDPPVKHIHFYTDKLKKDGDFFDSRIPYLRNDHVVVYTAHPNKNPKDFYKNAYASEFVFVHHGSGKLLTDYGVIDFVAGDQIVIPMGTVHQMVFDDLKDNKLFIVESSSSFEIPKHYRNQYGQCSEDAPYSERDFKIPSRLEVHDEKGEFIIRLKAGKKMYEYVHPYHPFDIVGWDGYHYPWAFNIRDYHPKVGRIHLPPPIHLLYNTEHFVLCNFNPRPFDWYPDAIAAPYFHTNVDSAEMLYYVEGDFMSRTGVVEGSITLHPIGLPHGPQPGKTEASIGVKETEEYAIMLDTFGALYPTYNVNDCEDEEYYRSWLEEGDK